MVTLALDTTSRAGSVAVMRDALVLSVVYGDAARTHGERLPEDFARALHLAGIRRRDVELLAVASGPGAFTGLRIGLAAIQGFAMVRQVPAIGVSALDALAEAGREAHRSADRGVVAWMDAQRGEVFAAHYVASTADPGRWEVISPPVVGLPDEMVRLVPPEIVNTALFIGDGAVRFRATIDNHTSRRARVMEPPAALAPFIGRIGLTRAARGEAGPPHALQPLYVRRSDAELARGART